MDQSTHPTASQAVQTIWLPAWLYHGLPRASMAIGLFGLTLLPEPNMLSVFGATAALVYGLTIAIIRAEHHRGNGNGW